MINYFCQNSSQLICENKNNYKKDHSESDDLFSNFLTILPFFAPRIIIDSNDSSFQKRFILIQNNQKKIKHSLEDQLKKIFILQGKIEKGGKYFARGQLVDKQKFKILKASCFSINNLVPRSAHKGIFEKKQK